MKKDVTLRRLDEIEELVKLGTLDTTILGLMVFVFATIISLISIGFPKLIINNPHLLIGILLSIIFAIPLIQYITTYVQTIFFEEGRFTIKKRVITLLLGEILFIFLLWAFLVIARFYEHWWTTPRWLVIVIFFVLLLASSIITWFNIKPGVCKYFDENFKALLVRRDLEIKKRK